LPGIPKGIEGHITMNGVLIPVSMKLMNDVKNIKNVFRNIRKNLKTVRQRHLIEGDESIRLGADANTLIYVEITKFGKADLLSFLTQFPDAKPEGGTFGRIILKMKDGVINLDTNGDFIPQ
jgi:hypothetical protein